MQVENREYLRTLKEKLPIFLINTLLLHIPLLALTHRQNYRETDRITDDQIHSLCVGWRNLCLCCCVIFFLAVNRFWFYILLMYLEYHKVVVFCQFFWFWWEIVFGVTYILSSVQYRCVVVSVFWREKVLVLHTYVLRVQYSCGVVLVFWFWQEIVFDVMQVPSVQYICAVVSFFLVVAGNSSQNENTFLQKTLLGYFIKIRQPM